MESFNPKSSSSPRRPKGLASVIGGLVLAAGLYVGTQFFQDASQTAHSTVARNPSEHGQSQERTNADKGQARKIVPSESTPTSGERGANRASDRNQAGGGSGDIRALLDELAIGRRERGRDYERHYFGDGWTDTDNNTCFTRADILARDLTKVKRKGRCKVVSGTLRDPYTNKEIEYESGRNTSELVQIDHVVALRDGWTTGAYAWDELKRVAFANDPLNLLAVDGDTNDDKGHKNAAEWLPPNKAFHCEYVARQIAVKARYGLRVTQDEHDAFVRVLKTCPSAMHVKGNDIINAS